MVEMYGKSNIVAMNSSQFMKCNGFSVATFPGKAYYWIGNDGLWSDPANWSNTSGGPSARCIPGFADSVFLDENSFSADGQIVHIDSAYPAVCAYFNANRVNRPCLIVADNYAYSKGISVAGSAVFSPLLELQVILSFYGSGIQSIDYKNTSSDKLACQIYGGGNYSLYGTGKNAGSLYINYGLAHFTEAYSHFEEVWVGAVANPSFLFARAYLRQGLLELNTFGMESNGYVVADSAHILFHSSLVNHSVNYYPTSIKQITGESIRYNNQWVDLIVEMQVKTPKMEITGNIQFKASIEADSLYFYSSEKAIVWPNDSLKVNQLFQMVGNACLRTELGSTSDGPGFISSDFALFQCDYLFVNGVKATGSANFDAGGYSVLNGNTGNWFINPNSHFAYSVAAYPYTICKDSLRIDLRSFYGTGKSWNWSDGQDSVIAWFAHEGDYALRVDYANNCFVLDTAHISSYDAIKDFLPADTFICGATSYQIIADSALLSGWQLKWSESIGDTLYHHLADSSDIYYLHASRNGCEKSDSQEVYIARSRPNILSLSDTSFCLGDSAQITVPFQAGITYVWSDDSTRIDRFVSRAGSYFLINRDSSCWYSDTVRVELIQIHVQILGDTFFCDGDSTLLKGLPAAGSFQWSSSDSSSEVYQNQSGTITLVRSDSGCVASDTVTLQKIALPVISFSGDSTFCEYDSTQIKATGTGNSWRWEDGVTTAYHWFNQQGIYRVRAEKYGCYKKDSVQIFSVVLPDTSWPDRQLCANDTVYLRVPVFPGVEFELNQNAVADSFLVEGEGNWIVSWYKGKCIKSDTFSTYYQKNIPFSIPDSVSFCDLKDRKLIIEVPSDYVMYWDGILMVSDGITVPDKTGAVVYQVFDSLNCEMQGSSTVYGCGCELYFPNAFTPNKDNLNSRYEWKGCEGLIREFKLSIYNRWGTLVFQSTNSFDSWDGTFKGSPCQEGVYVYRVTYLSEAEDGRYTRYNSEGTITLLRNMK